ncbi:MAG: hypothetical protein V3U69_03505 [Bacteroidota bacterium]
MNVLLDITVSTFVAGLIILTIVGLNGVISDAAFQTTTSVAVQQDISDLARIIEFDFYKIGYSADPAFDDLAFLYADSARLGFRSDIDRDSTAERIWYSLEDPEIEGLEGEAPPYKQLYRTVDDDEDDDIPELIGTGIVEFNLQYFNGVGVQLTGFPPTDPGTLASIRSIRIQVKLQSVILPDTVLGASYWEKYISPKNL